MPVRVIIPAEFIALKIADKIRRKNDNYTEV